jgi:hypothetical protein
MLMKTNSESVKNTRSNSTVQPGIEADELNPVSGSGIVPREQLIAEAAYFRAEQRGFEPGNEIDDWLNAEVEVTNRESLSGDS